MRVDDTLGMRLRGAFLAFQRFIRAYFAQFGVTSEQLAVLAILTNKDFTGRTEPVTQREMMQRTHSDANTMSAVLKRLEKKKLIGRENHVADGRARCVHLTAKGQNFIPWLWKQAEPFLLRRDLESPFTDKEEEVLRELLARIPAAMAKARKELVGRPDKKLNSPRRRRVRRDISAHSASLR